MKEESQLSKHNYSQYSNKNNRGNSDAAANVANSKPNNTQKPKPEMVKPAEKVEPVAATPEVVKPVEKVEPVVETVETVSLPDTVKGVVTNCARLNVRENATTDSRIVCVLSVMSEIKVDVNKSNNKWVYVYTATGAEGYCMREYIDARL